MAERTLCIVRRKHGGIGGAEMVAARYARAFSADWRVVLLSAGSREWGVSGARGPSWWRAWRFSSTAPRALARIDPDLVFTLERGICGDVFRAGELVHRRWARMKHPALGWVVNPTHWVMPCLERRTVASARAVVANSELVRREYAAHYPEHAAKIRVIRNGVDTAVFRPPAESRSAIRERLGLPTVGPLWLFVGSGWEIKGLDIAIRIVARLRAERVRPGLQLAVVGRGNSARYRRIAGDLGLGDAVRFVGPVGEVVPYYWAADAFLLPSRFDAFANACIEALACGCPVITTETNGAGEIVRVGKTGVVLRMDSRQGAPVEESWRLLLDFLAAGDVTPAEVAATVSALTLERELGEYRRLFDEILAEKDAHAR
jgi:UDP-glucose:(heptosyl)LPS alpha-1,3-glucosyltransferase